jgi:hypothetical protein
VQRLPHTIVGSITTATENVTTITTDLCGSDVVANRRRSKGQRWPCPTDRSLSVALRTRRGVGASHARTRIAHGTSVGTRWKRRTRGMESKR